MSRSFSRGWAPVSSGASSRLTLVGVLFYLNAGLAVLVLALNLADLIFHFLGVQRTIVQLILGFLVLSVWGGANWWTAKELHAGRRRALFVGLPIFGLLLIQELLRWPGNSIKIGLSALCLIALLSVWRELEA